MRKISLPLLLILFLCGDLHAQSGIADTAKIKELINELNVASKNNDYKTAAIIGKKLISLGMNDENAYFSEASVLGLSGDKISAIFFFDTAAAKGYGDKNNWNTLTGMLGISKDPLIIKATELVQKKSEKISAGGGKDVNPLLHALYLADQNERTNFFKADGSLDTVKILQLVHNDSLRRFQTYQLLKSNSLKTAQDFSEAALILQHGEDTSDYWTAHELALASIKLGNTKAKWLAAATLDRYLVAQHKLQKYGTQSFMNEKTNKLELYPVDPSVTDAERAEWDCPPLANALNAAGALYGK